MMMRSVLNTHCVDGNSGVPNTNRPKGCVHIYGWIGNVKVRGLVFCLKPSPGSGTVGTSGPPPRSTGYFFDDWTFSFLLFAFATTTLCIPPSHYFRTRPHVFITILHRDMLHRVASQLLRARAASCSA